MSECAPTHNVPAVTVLLPVLNGAKWIAQSLKSLHNQTFQDFEILVIDDGCTDSTLDIIRDMRITSLRVINGPGRGVGAALALGVSSAVSPLLARQDADDVSHPLRLEKQVRYMDANPECILSGTWANKIDGEGNYLGVMKVPRHSRAIKLRLNLNSPFIHPSVIMRRDAVLQVGNYRSSQDKIFSEDFDLWSRMALIGQMHNIHEPLISYRINPHGITGSHEAALRRSGSDIAIQNLEVTLDGDFGERERQAFRSYVCTNRRITVSEAMRIYKTYILIQSGFGFPPPLSAITWRSWLAPVVRTMRSSHRPTLPEG
jgi:glycosyltransferase involved in cell wall biosynthesis